MLGRRREQILILGALIGLNILLGWFLVLCWKEYRARTQWLSRTPAAQHALAGGRGVGLARQVQSFVEIVDRNLFSPLRGAAPPQPAEAAKAPKLPILFGTMDLGNGRFALMSPADQSPPLSKRILPGEDIGGYKLLTVGASNVVLEWQEQQITLEITEPTSHSPSNVERTANLRSGATGGGTPSQVSTVGSVSGGANPSTAASLGAPAGPQDVPAGTVVGGKRKVVVQTPFGSSVQWQDVGPAKSQEPQQAVPPPK